MALRAHSRGVRWRSVRTRRASYRLHRAIAGPVHCVDPTTRELRVLVVDDHESVRASVVELLRTSGFEVIEAANGRIALEAMELFEFDALVLDLAMPELDGAGVLDQMEHPPPVVLVTAGDYAEVVDAHGDRVFGVMRKPVAPSVLIALVGEAATAGRVERR